MSMTKRYLESLPADEQDAILGGVDNAYISPDEWVNDAENEPTEEESAEWARALMEEDDEEPNDPLVKCRICRESKPISEMNTNGECPQCQRETALIYELKPGLTRCNHIMRTSGHQCQLAAGHIGRHAWEESWVRRIAEIEAAERDAPLVKPEGECVTLTDNSGVEWKL